jgi:hypothetical protein
MAAFEVTTEVYPDSNHGANHMYPKLFAEHATLFLNG